MSRFTQYGSLFLPERTTNPDVCALFCIACMCLGSCIILVTHCPIAPVQMSPSSPKYSPTSPVSPSSPKYCKWFIFCRINIPTYLKLLLPRRILPPVSRQLFSLLCSCILIPLQPAVQPLLIVSVFTCCRSLRKSLLAAPASPAYSPTSPQWSPSSPAQNGATHRGHSYSTSPSWE